MITAPFNFVPLSEKVFFPDWAEDVSHDIPFEDAQSGVIDITLTAKSPIFIKNQSNDRENASIEFCNYNGEHYIPATSVKGMVRNVLEIMSFSKMTMVNDDTYAVRDIRNPELYMSKMTPDNTFCGWLRKDKDAYFIEDCGIPGRIRHEEIDKATEKSFSSRFNQAGFEKTSKYKYDILGQIHQVITVGDLYTSLSNAKYDKRLFCKYVKNGKEGTLVVTGQPTVRKNTGKMGDGKGFEFVFFESNRTINISEETYQNFLFAYFDGRKTEPKESPDWEYWKRKLHAGERVPVFFQKNGKEIIHFGLSYLYKLPYTHSVKDGIPSSHSDTRKDLAETIFGYVGKEKGLKGRIQFSHCKAISKAESLEPRTEILGTPRASYYPIYVRQQSVDFKTFMNEGFSIAGWKRYPIHSGAKVTRTTNTGNENIGTTFSPLKEGVLFQGKVRYYNLKKAELGALLSALSFHNTKGCFHNIGMAKSLGYGKIELKIDGIALEEYLKSFEVELSEQVENWAESEQLRELLSMASEQGNRGNSKLKYMELKAFADNKSKDKDFLRNYTMLEGIKSVAPKSLISEKDLDALRERQAERKKQEILHQEQKKREEEHKNKWDIVCESDNILTIEAFIRDYPETPYLNIAQDKLKQLKDNQDQADKEQAEEEAKNKWESVQKVDKKHYKKALEDFISNYAYSSFVKEAKEILKNISTNATVTTKIVNLDTVTNDEELFTYLKANKQTLDNNMDDIKKIVTDLFDKLESKKQKSNFIKKIDKSTYKNFSKKVGL